MLQKPRKVCKILAERHPRSTVPKVYRLGNVLFRGDYCNDYGVARPEAYPFARHPEEAAYRLPDLFHPTNPLFREKPLMIRDCVLPNLSGSVHYAIDTLDSQKTPHSCKHSACFMIMDYARQYYEALEQLRLNKGAHFKHLASCLQHFSNKAPHSGYDKGTGFSKLDILCKRLRLLTKDEAQDYGVNEMSIRNALLDQEAFVKCLSFLLFTFGPIVIHVRQGNDPYGHAVMLTGVLREKGQRGKKTVDTFIFADPWEGELSHASADAFYKLTTSYANKYEDGKLTFAYVPKPVNASFVNRLECGYPLYLKTSDTSSDEVHQTVERLCS